MKMTAAEKAYFAVREMRDQLDQLLVELSAEIPTRRRRLGPLVVKHNGKTIDLRGKNGKRSQSSTAHRQKARRLSG